MRKMTFAAVLVFIGLVAATVWTTRQKSNRGIAYVTLSDITIGAADRIEFQGAEPGLLEKKGDAWHWGNGRLADIGQVRNLLKSAEHIQSSDLLTQDASRFAEYGVDDQHGTSVRIIGGGHELAHLTAGRGLAGGMALRKGGAAYKVAGVFPNAFVHNANEWIERRLFLDTPSDDIAKVEIALRKEAPYALVREESGWTLAAVRGSARSPDFRLDGYAVQRLVTELANLKADVLLDADPGATVTGLNKAVDRLTFELKPKAEGESPIRRTVILGGTGENKSLYAQVVGSHDVAILPGYVGVNLRKSRENLRDLGLSKQVDAAQIKRLDLRSGTQRLALLRKEQTWSLPPGTPVPSGTTIDSMQAQRRAMDILNGRAAALAPGVTAAVAGIAPQLGEAKITLADKSRVALTFGRRAPGNQVYVQGSVDDKVYLVNAAFRDHILGMLETLRTHSEGDPLARFDQDGIGKLPPDVRAGLSEHFAQKKREQQAQQLMKGKRP